MSEIIAFISGIIIGAWCWHSWLIDQGRVMPRFLRWKGEERLTKENREEKHESRD